MSAEERRLRRPGVALLLAGGGAAVGLAAVLGTPADPAIVWRHYPLHAIVEGLGAFAALAMAVMLFVLTGRGRLPALFRWPATGLLAMGLLDGGHSALHEGEAFVWLHSMAVAAGGLLCSLVWLPAPTRRGLVARSLPLLAAGLGGGVVIAALLLPGSIPVMHDGRQFTPLAKTLNLLGGIGFLAAAARFALPLGDRRRPADLTIAGLAFLLAVAGFLFDFSGLWGPTWWVWHGLRVVALLTAMAYFFSIQHSSEEELHLRKEELETLINQRTDRLRAEIDERRKAEKALVQSQERLRDMAEAGTDWLWEMGPDLRFSYVSDSVRHVLDIEPEALIGQPRSAMLAPGEDPAKWQAHYDDLAQRRPFRDFQYRFAHPDGGIRHIRLSGKPVIDEWGRFTGYRGTGTDITDMVEQEEALRESERAQAGLFQATPDSVLMFDRNGTCLTLNDVAAARYGLYSTELIGTDLFELMPEPARSERRAVFDRVVRTGTPDRVETREGDRFFEARLQPITDERGDVVSVAVFARDVTEQRQAAEQIAKLARFPEENPSPVIQISADGIMHYANEPAGDLTEDWNCTPGRRVPEHVRILCAEALDAGVGREVEMRCGEQVYSLLLRPIPEAGHVNIYGRDITRWKEAERALRESEARAEDAWQRLRDALESISEAFAMFDARDRMVLCNAKYREMWSEVPDLLQPGARFEDLLRAKAEKHLVKIPPGRDLDTWIEEQMDLHRTGVKNMEMQLHDGSWWLFNDRRTEDGGYVVLRTDISQLKRREEALRKSESFLAASQRIAHLGSWEWDMTDGSLWWSQEIYRIFGQDPRAFDATYESFLLCVHPDDRDMVAGAVERAVAEGAPYVLEHRILRPDGEQRIVQEQGEVTYNEAGEATRMSGTVQDITERKRRDAELLQVQKMEAIGQLTGGIAHDFNNILTVIKGNLELLHGQFDPESQAMLRDIAEDALSAADQGSHLTGGLLAFARREPIQAKAVDLNALMERMVGLLRRTLHNMIEIETDLAADLPKASCDERLLGTAVLNLALNARDAMPKGGTLTLSTGRRHLDADDGGLPAGDYLALSVRDTGVGIPEELRARVFEPLFTTKAQGKGTGLGLRMVELFARESGGRTILDSVPDEGTTVTLLLPEAGDAEQGEDGPAPPAAAPAGTGGGVALLVDDEPKIRRFARRCLEELGYRVIEAGDAEEALAELQRHPEVTLLFSDIMMPGASNGLDLLAGAQKQHPGLQAILTSGSAEALGEAESIFGRAVPLLKKPFTATDLSAALAALPAPGPERRAAG